MVEITSPFVAYATDGAQTKFDITFEYQDGDPLEILLADTISAAEQTLIAGTHYVVEGSDTIGWSVRTIETYNYPYELYIIRDSDQVQESDYVENDPLPAERLEGDYDSAIKMIQELQRQIDRSLKLRSTAGAVDIEMADPVDGSVLKYMVTSGRYEAVKALDLAGITILPWMEEFLESVDYEEARIHLGGDAAWHEVGTSGEPVFENGWANSGGSYADMAFRLDSSGYVHLKGRVQGGTPDSVIFTLPVDYRPNKNQKFAAPYTDGEHQIAVESDGEVKDISSTWISQTVTDGVTDKAPSENAVYDHVKTTIDSNLPIGSVVMYDGTEIANVATRDEDIGDDVGDTISMPGWKVCNGVSGYTPDLIDSFIRSEIASGTTGGADTHTLTQAQMPAHTHPPLTGTGFFTRESTSPSWEMGTANVNAQRETTTGSTGGGGAHNNMPAYYSLIFIKRVT